MTNRKVNVNMSIQLEPPTPFWAFAPRKASRRLRREPVAAARDPASPVRAADERRSALQSCEQRPGRPLYGLAAAMNVLYQSSVPWVGSEGHEEEP
jgi:hypothetical protein